MKYYLKLLIFGVYFCALNSKVVALQTTPESEAKARQDWLLKFNNATSLPNEKSIPLIADGIRRLGDQSIFHDQEAARPVYQEGQRILLSIPGHATYYRDKINALREQLKTGKLSLGNWSSDKAPYFKMLEHMPSEEAVEALGGFAADKFGFVFSENPEDLDVPGLKEFDYSHIDYEIDFSVCYPAIKTLEVLIENPPASVGQMEKERQALWAQWWKEVKTGKRKFRFKGSSVEHPVKPQPGTFREQRRPERHPGPLSGTNPAEKPDASPSPPARKTAPIGTRWPFIAGIAGVLLAAAVFLLKIIRRK